MYQSITIGAYSGSSLWTAVVVPSGESHARTKREREKRERAKSKEKAERVGVRVTSGLLPYIRGK